MQPENKSLQTHDQNSLKKRKDVDILKNNKQKKNSRKNAAW